MRSPLCVSRPGPLGSLVVLLLLFPAACAGAGQTPDRRLAYLVSDLHIPFRAVLQRGNQQPFLMGEKAVEAMNTYLHGTRPVKQIRLPVLLVDGDNIDTASHLTRRNLLGISDE